MDSTAVAITAPTITKKSNLKVKEKTKINTVICCTQDDCNTMRLSSPIAASAMAKNKKNNKMMLPLDNIQTDTERLLVT